MLEDIGCTHAKMHRLQEDCEVVEDMTKIYFR